MAIARHGGEAHVMRPDRVYRTSVLSPMVGYQPQVDVQLVTQAFTQGPARGMMLEGLGGFGPFTKLKLRIQAWVAERRAAKMMTIAGVGRPSGMPGNSAFGHSSAFDQAAGIAPGPMQMASALMQGRYGAGYPVPALEYWQRRLNTYYRAG